MPPRVSFVVVARDEERLLPSVLASIRHQHTDCDYEVVVVDGGSTDRTREMARDAGARVVDGPREGIGAARNRGAEVATGEWLAFVDADTSLAPDYVDSMLAFVESRGLVAASSRYRFGPGRGLRVRVVEWLNNAHFPRADPPLFYGFNVFVDSAAFAAAGGFPEVANEDIAFSHRIAAEGPTAVHPERLVTTSARRLHAWGLTLALLFYLWLDVRRRLTTGGGRSGPPGGDRSDRVAASGTSPLAPAAVAVLGGATGAVNVYEWTVHGPLEFLALGGAFLAGTTLFLRGGNRRLLALLGVPGAAAGLWLWTRLSGPHPPLGALPAGVQAVLLFVLGSVLVAGWRRTVPAGQGA